MVAVARGHAGGAGIVYTLSRADAEKVAAGFCARGVRAAAYHAGLDGAQRHRVQASWQQGGTPVVVATVAFGLGIDKPDVRFVLHHTTSKSLEAYYQESGRAGRDGLPAELVAWWRPSDYFRLASLAYEGRDHGASVRQLNAAANFCERGDRCRREHFADLFGQPKRAGGGQQLAVPPRCCDVCVALGGAPQAEASARAPPPAHASSAGRDAAAAILRVLHAANEASASTDGGPAPAGLTALKLVDKAASHVKQTLKVKPSRDDLERLVLRLVLTDAIRVHPTFTAYSILTYLHVRPTLRRRLLEEPTPPPDALGIAAFAAEVFGAPSTTAPATSAGKRPRAAESEAAAAAPTKSSGSRQPKGQALPRQAPPGGCSDDSDFEVAPAGLQHGEVIVLD